MGIVCQQLSLFVLGNLVYFFGDDTIKAIACTKNSKLSIYLFSQLSRVYKTKSDIADVLKKRAKYKRNAHKQKQIDFVSYV